MKDWLQAFILVMLGVTLVAGAAYTGIHFFGPGGSAVVLFVPALGIVIWFVVEAIREEFIPRWWKEKQ